MHEPERKGLWTVSEDDKGEQEAEWEEEIKRSRTEAFERCLSRWTREDEGELADGFVDVDLFDQKTLSCSTSCTSEEPSQCITPSLESDNLTEDVFFGASSNIYTSRTKRTSTCSFENATSEEDEADLFFAPTMSGRALGRRFDLIDMKRNGYGRGLEMPEDW